MNELIQRMLTDKNVRTESDAEALVTTEDAFETWE